jgi:hypothetical protein
MLWKRLNQTNLNMNYFTYLFFCDENSWNVFSEPFLNIWYIVINHCFFIGSNCTIDLLELFLLIEIL